VGARVAVVPPDIGAGLVEFGAVVMPVSQFDQAAQARHVVAQHQHWARNMLSSPDKRDSSSSMKFVPVRPGY